MNPHSKFKCNQVIQTIVMLLLALQCSSNLVAQNQVPNLKKDRPQQFSKPFLIEFQGEINWKLSKYLRAKIEQARTSGADLLVFEIDSPGGLKTESLNLAELIRDIDWAYTVAFVPREALSGAALVTFGCDELVVGELARIGDIGIIQYDPQLFAFRFAPEKIQSVLVRQARDLAASKGRSGELAEAMINKEFIVYQRTKDGQVEYLGQPSEDTRPVGGWEVVPESKKGFLTVNGVRAQELGLASQFSKDRDEIAKLLSFELSQARILRHTFTDDVVYLLNHPIITGFLILIGLVALLTELSVPGIGVGGLLAGLCAALFFWSRFLGGTSTWLEVLLFAAGAVFLLMELFVIPGWGVSGVMGIFLMTASIFMASQDFVIPSDGRQWNQFLTSMLMLACSGLLFVIAAAFIVKNLGYIPIFSKLVLAPPVEESDDMSKDDKPGILEHPDVSVGDWGRAESLLRPAGRAIFAGRSFDVVSDGEFIEPGSQVKVLDIQGNRIVVSAIEPEPNQSKTV